MNMVFLSAYFAPAVPFGPLITCFGLFLMYWTHKWCMLKNCRMPPYLGYELSAEMTDLLEFIPLIYAASNLYFNTVIRTNFDNSLSNL